MDTKQKRFLYVRVQVVPTDPDQSSLFNGLLEKTTGQVQPDIVPPVHPGGISFEHCFVEATDMDDAYLLGYRELPDRKPQSVMNDYVISLP